MTKTNADVVDSVIDDLKGRDSLADTPFSQLFHEARTTTPDDWRTNGYSSVTVQVRVRDGQLETSDPVKTRQEERLRGTKNWHTTISLPVTPFMEVRVASEEIRRQLRVWKRNLQPSGGHPAEAA